MTTTPPPTLPLRILIADDHDVMREGTRAVIERQPGWEVCGIACTGREAVAQAIQLQPDIVIMDMSMPDLNGLDAAVQIKRRLPRTEILMFTAHETEELIRQVFEAGAKSFIFKSQAHTYLIDAIQSLAQHKPFFTSKVSETLFADILNRSAPNSNGSQDRAATERAGTGNRAPLIRYARVTKEVGVSTTWHQRANSGDPSRPGILQKLGLNSTAGLVRYAIRNKIIEARPVTPQPALVSFHPFLRRLF